MVSYGGTASILMKKSAQTLKRPLHLCTWITASVVCTAFFFNPKTKQLKSRKFSHMCIQCLVDLFKRMSQYVPAIKGLKKIAVFEDSPFAAAKAYGLHPTIAGASGHHHVELRLWYKFKRKQPILRYSLSSY